jgi:predicted nucleic acid-binding protein
MARIFLDTNIFIDTVHRKPENGVLDSLRGHSILISPLSVHIYCYSFQIKIPETLLREQLDNFDLVDLDSNVTQKAITGPTNDMEDNIQLHSAAQSDCDIFLTNDKKLLKMKFFGKTRIVAQV